MWAACSQMLEEILRCLLPVSPLVRVSAGGAECVKEERRVAGGVN